MAIDAYPGELSFQAGQSVFWNDVANAQASPNYLPLERPDFTDPQHGRVAQMAWHALGRFAVEGGRATLMELPEVEYRSPTLRRYRRDLYNGLGIGIATILRDDMSGPLPDSPLIDPRGTIVYKGVLGNMPIVTISRITTSNNQELRQLSIHEATPPHTLHELSQIYGDLTLEDIIERPPEPIAATLHSINAYSAAEAARVRTILEGRNMSAGEVDEIFNVADRWTAPDPSGLWLVTMYIKNRYRIPENLAPSMGPYTKRLRLQPMSPSQDELLEFVASTTEAEDTA